MRLLRLATALIVTGHLAGSAFDGAFHVGRTGSFSAPPSSSGGCMPTDAAFVFWASDMEGDGDGVSTSWSDSDAVGDGKYWHEVAGSSSLDFYFDNATSTKRAIWDESVPNLNSQPGVFFDGVDDFLDASIAAPNFAFLSDSDKTVTCYLVKATDASPVSSGYLITTQGTGAGNAEGMSFYVDSTGTRARTQSSKSNGAAASWAMLKSSAYAADSGTLTTLIHRGSVAGDDAEIFVDGSSIITSEQSDTWTLGPQNPIKIGNRDDEAVPWEGWIGFFGCWAGAHDEATRGTVEACLESAEYYGAEFPL